MIIAAVIAAAVTIFWFGVLPGQVGATGPFLKLGLSPSYDDMMQGSLLPVLPPPPTPGRLNPLDELQVVRVQKSGSKTFWHLLEFTDWLWPGSGEGCRSTEWIGQTSTTCAEFARKRYRGRMTGLAAARKDNTKADNFVDVSVVKTAQAETFSTHPPPSAHKIFRTHTRACT